jgi:arylsulfatase A-like enzyme
MRWPGHIPAGTTCSELAATLDLFPTIARLIGAELPNDRVIDGKDIWQLMAGEPDAKSPHEVFYCYYGGALCAVRDRRWKLVFPHEYRSLDGGTGGRDGKPAAYTELKTPKALYDLAKDIGETTDVADKHPDVVARLESHAEKARAALGDTLSGRKGSEVRPAGQLAGVAQNAVAP